MKSGALIILALICQAVLAETQLLQHSDKNISIHFSTGTIVQSPIVIDDAEYARVSFDGSRMHHTDGGPMIPYKVVRVALPPESDVQVTHQIIGETEISNIDLLPAITISGLEEGSQVPRDESIYGSSLPYPANIIEISEPYNYRQLRVVDVRVYPLQYFPLERRARVFTDISIQVKPLNSSTNYGTHKFSSADDFLLGTRLVNYDEAKGWALPKSRGFAKQVSYDFSTGDWYKIPVTSEGIYRLTGSTLEDNGIDLGDIASADMIQMFNYGGNPLSINVTRERPEELGEIAIEVIDQNGNGQFDSNDEILFYGKGLGGWEYDDGDAEWTYKDHVYDVQNYYLFTYNRNVGKRITTTASPNDAGAIDAASFQDLLRFEEDNHNILQSGLDWYWEELRGVEDDQSFTIELPSSIISAGGSLGTRIQGGSGSGISDPNNFSYTLTATLNGNTVLPLTAFQNNSTKNYNVDSNSELDTEDFVGGSNNVTFNYTGSAEGCYIYVDFLEARVFRPFTAEDNFLQFYYNSDGSATEFSISSMPSGTHRVWDMTDLANIAAITPLQNGNSVRFQNAADAPQGSRYRVFATSTIQNISDMTQMENSPNLRDPLRRGKLLLIVADDFYDAAAAYEDLKENDVPPLERMETTRVKTSEIYREFSSAVVDPTAIRDFIKYARENWDQDPLYRPEYVFIMGDGSYDYRNIELTSYTNRVPVFEITNRSEIHSRACDIFFTAIANNSDSPTNLDPHLPIGRLHANSADDVLNFTEKMREYTQAYINEDPLNAGWQTTITFVADDECAEGCNEWFHTEQTERLVDDTPTKYDISKIYLVDYPVEAGGLGRTKPLAAEALLDALNKGTLIINFYGHGDPNTWTHEQVLNKGRDLPLINNGAKLPLWVAATCTWGRYDDPNVPSMAEEMIWSEDGGGIGVLAASRAVYAFENEDFVNGMWENLFVKNDTRLPSIPLGDAVLTALDGGTNDQKYHIFGDPSMRLADPENLVGLEPVSSDTLRALSETTITANLIDTSGTPLSNFNGKALIRVYDAVDSASTKDGDIRYVHQGGTLFRGIVSVENGQLESSFIIPKSIKYQDSRTGRISIYAWSEDDIVQDATGYSDTLLFMGSVEGGNDTDGPDIGFSIEEQPDFFDGDHINQQSTVIVDLYDESGINLTGEVGHQIELTIDDNIRKDVTQFFVYEENSYQSGKLAYTLPLLSPGEHKVTITAWDNLNNYSEQQIALTTTTSTELSLAQVVNYPNPFADETHFTFQFQSPTSIAEVLIKIYTVRGRLIEELTDVARPGFNKVYWDGTDRNGDLVANGTYLYKIIVDDGEQRIEKIEKMAIIR